MWFRKRVYLDNAAGAGGNPSSPHKEGRRSREILEGARTNIARLLEVRADDVIFTSGATEANALAILGTARSRQMAVGSKKLHALYLPSAHASVVENMHQLAEEGVEIEALPIRDSRVDTNALAKMLRDETVLVSMDAVCGETGVVWNTREVAEVIRNANARRASLAPSGLIRMSQPVAATSTSGVRLHVDASQAPLTEKITRAHFRADMLTFDGSKVGVRGIGTLVAHRTPSIGGSIEPLYRGGGQERGLRPGSEASELAQSFAAALHAAVTGRENFRVSAEKDRTELIALITEFVTVQHLVLNINEGRVQAPNILNISLLGIDTDYLVALLDEAGFAVSTRSACETDSEDGSRAVLALTGDVTRAKSTLRISWGPGIRSRDLVRFAEALSRALAICR
ncbi:hypothetical protein A2678_03330 [Candidatus Kaiserbacteria bacterium RIFCSPHIGHO2_01_FULL_53_31]|uniref:Aminotransferase class V domain-containing protein n=1 Tax=Candidatus Kaiserbacteria bacterium RIFCSPHIGHO2_01_FULL_53_31 TaxID=1798481 RepID=A0A1F6CH64_9BACT|nr:MAG: hypothetical protein A2678_03330 [Candidatus Kaiserbacteria bacterium RIFCSPHIGHO2_01_FULL_53_31]